MLKRLNHIPNGLLDCKAQQLYSKLKGPTLIELEGKNKQPLFISALLHGNETSGWEVCRRLLKKYEGKELPRSLILFLGNVEAASKGLRKLDSQPDYNRIWIKGETKEHLMVQSLLKEMSERKLFASVDIHNNTGINPHYACINRLDNSFINLARAFTRMVIYFVRPTGVQSKAFSKLCPSVTLECGQAGDEYGIQLAYKFIDALFNSKNISNKKVIEKEIDLFHTIGIIKVNKNASISFDEKPADINFIRGIEHLNFEEIPASTQLANLSIDLEDGFLMLNENGKNIAKQLFEVKDKQLLTKKPLMLSMLTTDIRIIRQDCLCYIMERYKISMGEKKIRENQASWLS